MGGEYLTHLARATGLLCLRPQQLGGPGGTSGNWPDQQPESRRRAGPRWLSRSRRFPAIPQFSCTIDTNPVETTTNRSAEFGSFFSLFSAADYWELPESSPEFVCCRPGRHRRRTLRSGPFGGRSGKPHAPAARDGSFWHRPAAGSRTGGHNLRTAQGCEPPNSRANMHATGG